MIADAAKHKERGWAVLKYMVSEAVKHMSR
jgi:hypothetical protein